MKYPRSEKYTAPEWMAKMMGPNPVKLEEELLLDHRIPEGSVVCDLGSGQGLTSVFLAREYGFKVYAADLWSDPEENRKFFESMGLSGKEIIPVKEKGLSATVYTQVSDVEDEINGIVTYDRKVVKFNPAYMRAIHYQLQD